MDLWHVNVGQMSHHYFNVNIYARHCHINKMLMSPHSRQRALIICYVDD